MLKDHSTAEPMVEKSVASMAVLKAAKMVYMLAVHWAYQRVAK